METIPQFLFLHLKKFRQSGDGYRKNRGEVLLPHIIEVQQEMYRICAVVNHIGSSMSSGHYTADVKVDAFNWMKCDDVRVRDNRGLKRVSSEAYLIFCELINTDEKIRVSADHGCLAPASPVNA